MLQQIFFALPFKFKLINILSRLYTVPSKATNDFS